MGIQSAMMKLWQHRGLVKVVTLKPNYFQFIFEKESERLPILQARPWFFDNQLIVLQLWREDLECEDVCFKSSPL